ncbi:MAG TPA: alpha-2-macroglobulin family protein [Chitinophaga sp.]|uniref:alpha-2-macroglobulin family protein n=1 Tax=Chitinophaga sp. TaxID=1869181 RepID=UPI002CCEF9F7|nr:alpha-2-macroglobulin family protein [Chitinophaga sp.]HVI49049.1 alpha-2-macroglobulin family protein [Chitinophaga sp.]
MKRHLILFLCLVCVTATAQRNLSGSRTTGPVHFVYKLTDDEARAVYKETLQRSKAKAYENLLHTLVTSFPDTIPFPSSLPPGNYLEVHADRNDLVYQFRPVRNLHYKIIGNGQTSSLLLHNNNGYTITDAVVLTDKRYATYNVATSTYHISKKFNGIAEARYNNVLNLFRLSPENNNRSLSWWKKVWLSFKRKINNHRYNHHRRIYDYRSYRTPFSTRVESENHYAGYMVTSKPLYKPHDTVKLKAYILHKDGKPVNTPLQLRLFTDDLETDTIITLVHPYIPGGYEYQFALNDSLDIDLDDKYQLTLELPGKPAHKEKKRKEDDDDDNGKTANRQVLIRSSFTYEEYDLKSITFSARTDQSTHTRGLSVSLYLKAVDENGLPVADGRVSLQVLPGSISNYQQSPLFIADTLWQHEVILEPAGETKVTLPDSIFPAATLDYTIYCQFLNSSNERQTQSLRQHYNYHSLALRFAMQDDSLHITAEKYGKQETVQARLLQLNNDGDTISNAIVRLPYQLSPQPHINSYKVIADSTTADFTPDNNISGITCNTSRTQDSVFVQVGNPRRLHFWYSIFANNRLLKTGYTDSLYYAARSVTAKNYRVDIRYMWGDEIVTNNYHLPFYDKSLQMQIKGPVAVYPGQTARLSVTVNNASGIPVKDADVTAYGLTAKFRTSAPNIPYSGKVYPNPRILPGLLIKQQLPDNFSGQMNWAKWKNEMSLDSIAFYQFLHPAGIYYNTENTSGDNTQLAPFVMINGNAQRIIDVWIDNIPVYFDKADFAPVYSFPVLSGYHHVKLRISDREIKADSVYAEYGKKTFVSMQGDTINRLISFQKMPPKLTPFEKSNWEQFLMPINVQQQSPLIYIRQDQRVLLPGTRSPRSYLAGPLFSSSADYVVKGKFEQPFKPEQDYVFTIDKGLVKEKEARTSHYYTDLLLKDRYTPSLSDEALTENKMAQRWEDIQDQQSITYTLYPSPSNQPAKGTLTIQHPLNVSVTDLKQVFLYQYDDPAYIQVFPLHTTRMYNLAPGRYRVLVLLRKNRYYIGEDLTVKANGNNYYDLQGATIMPSDSISEALAKMIAEQVSRSNQYTYTAVSREDFTIPFNNQYLSRHMDRLISGTVTDPQGNPLTGVTLSLKGTSYGTVTDQHGRFQLAVTRRGTLRVAYIGYITDEVKIDDRNYYRLELTESTQHLEEVVVVGYGVSSKKSVTASVSTINGMLAGRVAGVQIQGTGSLNTGKPLVIVDGIPYEGSTESITKDQIKEMNVLKGEAAVALYGTRAANGVIVITTNKSATGQPELTGAATGGSALRHNFRDDAFWQPRLRTNEKGEAAFNVTFPDDITSWQLYAIGATERLQTGIAGTRIKSYKPVSANLALPAFLVTGDTLHVIGKVLNYTPDSTTVVRTFQVDGRELLHSSIGVRNSRIDTIPVVAPGADSIGFKYTIAGSNDYFDGEYRALPIFEQGVRETQGLFLALHKDTSFALPADTAALHIHAGTGMLPVLLDEIERLDKYAYYCNEQMASKLIALVLQKKIFGYQHKTFKDDDKIRMLIRKLQDNQNETGLWGWWNKSEAVYWISVHATNALLAAEDEGFKINIRKELFTSFLIAALKSSDNNNKLSVLESLAQLKAKVNFREYLDTFNTRYLSGYDRLRLMYLKVRTGVPVSTDTLIARREYSMMGNYYWGPESYDLFNNSVQYTLLVYKILREQGGHEDLLHFIRSWFMENRRNGCWRNTYESASILETILPDVMKSAELQPATLTINDQRITAFPYNTIIRSGTPVNISKSGGMPVYFTSWKQHWNPAPEKVSGKFEVRSSFEKDAKEVNRLTAGTPVTMKVEVDVKADAEYVMIEVPVPAGCSYESKSQGGWWRTEAHREYYKNKVSIFCNMLRRGKHVFHISLIPRYSGSFHINPAKAEMMYFPVFFGRETMKQVVISGK